MESMCTSVLHKSRFQAIGPTGDPIRHRSAVNVITSSSLEKRKVTMSKSG
jgi:hypothetical protein